MKKLQLLLLLFFGIQFTTYSQYEYKLELESLNGNSPKVVLSEISNEISITHKYIVEGGFTFRSEIEYTSADISNVLEIYGYTLKSFTKILREEDYLKTE